MYFKKKGSHIFAMLMAFLLNLAYALPPLLLLRSEPLELICDDSDDSVEFIS